MAAEDKPKTDAPQEAVVVPKAEVAETKAPTDGRKAVVFRGHSSPDNHTQVIRTEDGDFRVGTELRLAPAKLSRLQANGYLFDPVH